MTTTWSEVGSRWSEEVGAALGFIPETPVLGLSEELDYQGSCYFVAEPTPGEIVVYGWSYGSCSGCDGWEGQEDEIPAEVQGAAQRMTLDAFRAYAAGVLAAPESEWEGGYPSNRAAVAAAMYELTQRKP